LGLYSLRSHDVQGGDEFEGCSTEIGRRSFPVPEIPAVEREQEWRKRKLRRKVHSEIMDRFREDNE
jgi:hypothetical protein